MDCVPNQLMNHVLTPMHCLEFRRELVQSDTKRDYFSCYIVSSLFYINMTVFLNICSKKRRNLKLPKPLSRCQHAGRNEKEADRAFIIVIHVCVDSLWGKWRPRLRWIREKWRGHQLRTSWSEAVSIMLGWQLMTLTDTSFLFFLVTSDALYRFVGRHIYFYLQETMVV